MARCSGSFRRLIPTSPWCLGMAGHSRGTSLQHLYRDRQNIASMLPGALVTSHPIKGQARTLQEERDDRQDTSPKPSASNPRPPTQRPTSQAIIFVLFSLSLRLGLAALSRKLVTPTQAPRCKKIQTSPPAGRRAFFCPNQDKPPCVLLASPSRKGTRSTHSSV
jgi:hypothetical protein